MCSHVLHWARLASVIFLSSCPPKSIPAMLGSAQIPIDSKWAGCPDPVSSVAAAIKKTQNNYAAFPPSITLPLAAQKKTTGAKSSAWLCRNNAPRRMRVLKARHCLMQVQRCGMWRASNRGHRSNAGHGMGSLSEKRAHRESDGTERRCWCVKRQAMTVTRRIDCCQVAWHSMA